MSSAPPQLRSLASVGFAVLLLAAIAAGPADAASPAAPVITEPKAVGAVVHPADVHMEASRYSDPDGDAHACSDWEIVEVGTGERAWSAPCVGGSLRIHVHLPEGTFGGDYSGRTELDPETEYRVRVRFEDSSGAKSAWATRVFATTKADPGEPGAGWKVREPGFRVEKIAGGFQLPVNIAFVPDPGRRPSDPLLYVVELHRGIKVVLRDGTVRSYAKDLLNFDPLDYVGSAEQGVTGIAVDPASGDVFASMLYQDTASNLNPKPRYPKVVRFVSTDRGRTAASQKTILDLRPDAQEYSHQISNLSIGPDGHLYIHNGDGHSSGKAQNLESYNGKVLRTRLDGTPVPDNPFYSASNGITPRDYVFAYGFRNPFGGAWRASDGGHYEVENGPTVDRFAKVVKGRDYGWGTPIDDPDELMERHAIYNWDPATAPVNISFVQHATFGGSGFPASLHDQAFVTTSGPTWASGAPKLKGKRIVRFVLAGDGALKSGPRNFIEYAGTGKASAAALAAGPDGLYFSDLYRDDGTSPLDPGANILRVRYTGHAGNHGTAASEHLYGDNGRDRLAGGGGDDLIVGRGGADRLWGQVGKDILIGGAHNDRLDGGAHADLVNGGTQADLLIGGRGADHLWGGKGRDRIRAGAGNDVIRVRDGSVDRISCGSGRDRVIGDSFDKIAADCERRR